MPLTYRKYEFEELTIDEMREMFLFNTKELERIINKIFKFTDNDYKNLKQCIINIKNIEKELFLSIESRKFMHGSKHFLSSENKKIEDQKEKLRNEINFSNRIRAHLKARDEIIGKIYIATSPDFPVFTGPEFNPDDGFEVAERNWQLSAYSQHKSQSGPGQSAEERKSPDRP